MKKVTALLLNWKRPKNLKRVIQSIRSQSVPIEIFLWNNNIDDTTQYDVDLHINSNKNLMCWPRWFMANYADDGYIFSLDDDLLLDDTTVISDCITYAEEYKVSIGYCGVILNASREYWKSQHINTPKCNGDTEVDIIKGRFMFHHVSHLDALGMVPRYDRDEYGPRIEDDIILSSVINRKIIPSFLHNRLQELKSNDALYDQENHRESRQDAVRYYFGKDK